jgi:hypothetical protein
LNNQRIISLTPPHFTSAHIQEKIICIRGHRERLFNTGSQEIGNKVIFHNYGQGGAGWTFLFSCVHESIRQFENYSVLNPSKKLEPIIIIGAGCYGLLTAIILARKGYTVKIIAKELQNVSSDKAAGFFFPRPRKVSNAQEKEIFYARGIESLKTYLEIIQGAHPFINKGAYLLPAYYAPEIDPELDLYISKGLLQPPQKVIIDFGNEKKYSAMEYQSIFINSAQLMHELRENIAQHNIEIVQQEINSFDEVDASVIFNCTGWGAKQLTHDTRLVPVQGHLIILKNQPHLEQLQYMINFRVTMLTPKGTPRDELIYFAPKESGILGITFLRGQESHTSNVHEFDRLLQRCHDFFGT